LTSLTVTRDVHRRLRAAACAIGAVLSMIFCLLSLVASRCALLYAHVEGELTLETRFVVSYGAPVCAILGVLALVLVIGSALCSSYRWLPWLFIGLFGLLALYALYAVLMSMFVDMVPATHGVERTAGGPANQVEDGA
jgi:uncharacterized BrkB/YihY/UPF0761 family membrane protein